MFCVIILVLVCVYLLLDHSTKECDEIIHTNQKIISMLQGVLRSIAMIEKKQNMEEKQYRIDKKRKELEEMIEELSIETEELRSSLLKRASYVYSSIYQERKVLRGYCIGVIKKANNSLNKTLK